MAIQKKYQERELLILGISMDDPRKVSDEDLRGFIMKYQINYPILRYNQRLLVDYFNGEIPAIPVTFIVDREGRIVEKFTGYRPGALEKKVLQLMRK